jgi:nucleoside-diphosphate-sugar epimerase
VPQTPGADRVVVTGAAGFIGSALRRLLIAEGAAVHAVSRSSHAAADEAEKWWQLDVREPGALDDLVREVEPDVLFHLAGETSAARDLALVRPTFEANAVSTVNVLSAVAAGSPETRVVVAGSLEEGASSPYALSKATAHAYGRLFHELYGTRVVHLRVFMTYGPAQLATRKLVPYVTLALLAGEPAQISSGRRLVDWIYVDDVAAAFLAAGAAGAEADGGSFDVGSGELTSVGEVAEEIRRIVGGGALELGAQPDRPREQEPVADTDPTERALGWRATTPLAEGLRRTVEWYARYGSKTSFRT